ncbi:MAG: DUF1648 domain-containing protein [Chthoniobacteraceae bacterium]
MKDRTVGIAGPLVVLVALLVAFAAYVTMTMNEAPVRLATHFDADGEPNDWMTRGGYRAFILGFGFGVPALMVALFWIIAKLGGRGLNVPNKDYWLAPERRESALAFIRRHGVWIACIQVGFFAALHHLTLAANALEPPRLPAPELIAIVACFLGGTGLWVIVLLRRFGRPATEPAP